jgi:hypothetical protein
MKLQIVGVVDRKSAGNERLHLRALADANLMYYVVVDTTYISPTSISNKLRHTYWFPNRPVKAGDHVVLYSAAGTESKKINADGTTSHFFYWGLGSTVWNNTGDCAMVFEINTWMTSAYE